MGDIYPLANSLQAARFVTKGKRGRHSEEDAATANAGTAHRRWPGAWIFSSCFRDSRPQRGIIRLQAGKVRSAIDNKVDLCRFARNAIDRERNTDDSERL